MDLLLQYVFTGLSAGSLYALVALGIVLIYRSTRVLNFAHGDIATLATFVAFSFLSHKYSFTVALGASLLVGAFAAVSEPFVGWAWSPTIRAATLITYSGSSSCIR